MKRKEFYSYFDSFMDRNTEMYDNHENNNNNDDDDNNKLK